MQKNLSLSRSLGQIKRVSSSKSNVALIKSYNLLNKREIINDRF